MAIYESPAGEVDPRPRCTGHCCRQFSTEFNYKEVLQDYENFLRDPQKSQIPDIAIIAPMLIPLGTFRGQELFTCKNLGPTGNCQIYATRPQMCRDFPGPNPCPYRNCSSHGKQSTAKKIWNWLRD